MRLLSTTLAALALAACARGGAQTAAPENGRNASGAEYYGSSAPGTYGSDTGPSRYDERPDATAAPGEPAADDQGRRPEP